LFSGLAVPFTTTGSLQRLMPAVHESVQEIPLNEFSSDLSKRSFSQLE